MAQSRNHLIFMNLSIPTIYAYEIEIAQTSYLVQTDMTSDAPDLSLLK